MEGNGSERFLRALYENAGDGFIGVSCPSGKSEATVTRWFTKEQIPEIADYLTVF